MGAEVARVVFSYVPHDQASRSGLASTILRVRVLTGPAIVSVRHQRCIALVIGSIPRLYHLQFACTYEACFVAQSELALPPPCHRHDQS